MKWISEKRFLASAVVLVLAGLLRAEPPADDPFAASNRVAQASANAAEADPFAAANKAGTQATTEKPSPKAFAPGAAAAPVKGGATARFIDFTASVTPREAKPGQTVRVTISGTPKPGYHTYPITKRAKDQDELYLTRLAFQPNPRLKPLWPVTETEPELAHVKGVGNFLEHARPFTWEQDVLVLPDASPGETAVQGKIELQVCDASHCVPDTWTVTLPLTVSAGPAVPLTPALEERLRQKQPEPVVVAEPAQKPSTAQAPPAAPAAPGREGPAVPAKSGSSDLLAFILQGIFWGAVSLVTPCVFPMIPITVSFFLKQSEKEHHRPITMAAVYCSTIIVVLTISAVALLSFFTKVSTHPLTNFGLGALFIFFALSLFGMYEIELPSSLAQFTSTREGKGGLMGTMFMALTFTIISFACVAPFMGGFGGTAAATGLGWSHRILGGLAFAATFASPFFVLALFPTLLRKMPKSGTWLNSVKVVMGFLELAAALKFFRAGELVWSDVPAFFTYDLVLGVYVALSFLCGLYLLNVYRLPHDTPIEHLGVPRLLWSVAFLSLGLYLLPALFKYNEQGANQRPTGAVFAWLDSFLLPEPRADEGGGLAKNGSPGTQEELRWTGNLQQGLADAREKGRLVFVDFTGVTCTNCSYNERNVFPLPAVRELMGRYSLVQLYTDRVPNRLYPPEEVASFQGGTSKQKEDAVANREFQSKYFNTTQLPLYVILQPSSGGGYKEVARYVEGKINDPAAFAEFLRQPLAPTKVALREPSGR